MPISTTRSFAQDTFPTQIGYLVKNMDALRSGKEAHDFIHDISMGNVLPYVKNYCDSYKSAGGKIGDWKKLPELENPDDPTELTEIFIPLMGKLPHPNDPCVKA